jgi:hypothetical protein
MQEIRRVLVCDDDLRRGVFEEWFAADRAQRLASPTCTDRRWLEVDGPVCRTLSELRDALEESEDAGVLPDLVLIDDRLQPERGGPPVRSALKAVRLITSMLGERRPKCVLHTSELHPNDVWTFCALGGHHAVDKFQPLERMQILWATLDGACWMPTANRRSAIDIDGANGRLLPYMEHSHWKYNARLDLPDLADSDVEKVDNRLFQAKRRLLDALDLPAGAEAREIVDAAHDHGIVWVPLAHRHLLPEAHPEHRATAFRHRLPPPKSPAVA